MLSEKRQSDTTQALGTIRRSLRIRVLPCLESAAVPRLTRQSRKDIVSATGFVATWECDLKEAQKVKVKPYDGCELSAEKWSAAYATRTSLISASRVTTVHWA